MLRHGSRADLRATARQARLGVAACFLLTGVISTSWVSRAPAIKDGLDLSDGQFAIAVLGLEGLVPRPRTRERVDGGPTRHRKGQTIRAVTLTDHRIFVDERGVRPLGEVFKQQDPLTFSYDYRRDANYDLLTRPGESEDRTEPMVPLLPGLGKEELSERSVLFTASYYVEASKPPGQAVEGREPGAGDVRGFDQTGGEDFTSSFTQPESVFVSSS